ncbi:MAG: hypothetical protein LKG22_03155 [Sphingobium sp.]|nr:hypothetical protein [Sphingobium sp.]MCI2052702.1 hypothetical protein [Sphingobium sp.]
MSNMDRADNSELRVFVAETLRAVMSGISEVLADTRFTSIYGSGEHAFGVPEKVDFDVAVSAEHSGASSGGFKLQVFGVSANTGGEAVSKGSTISRIAFSVPTQFKKYEDRSEPEDRYGEIEND